MNAKMLERRYMVSRQHSLARHLQTAHARKQRRTLAVVGSLAVIGVILIVSQIVAAWGSPVAIMAGMLLMLPLASTRFWVL